MIISVVQLYIILIDFKMSYSKSLISIDEKLQCHLLLRKQALNNGN